jgi:hypothetical protein
MDFTGCLDGRVVVSPAFLPETPHDETSILSELTWAELKRRRREARRY